jgi:hypothetical protein
MVMLNLPRRAAGSRLPRAVAPVRIAIKERYMLLNAIEEQKRATPLWIFACQPPRGDRD